MKKKSIFISLATALMVGSTLFAQKGIDPTKLDPESQLLNANIQVIDLIKNRNDVARLSELIPKMSEFVLAQIDSIDVYDGVRDTVYMTFHCKNKDRIAENGYCVPYLNGVRKGGIMANPLVVPSPPLKEGVDLNKFEFFMDEIPIKQCINQETVPRVGRRIRLLKTYFIEAPAKTKKEESKKSWWSMFD